MKVFARLSGAAALLAAVAVGVLSTASSSARTTHSKSIKPSSFTLGVVADTGGLNDHGFNHLAYMGELEAHAKLGVKYQVLVSTSSADYVPYLTKEAENGDKLVVAVGFDFTDALGQVAKEFPKTHFAIIDTPANTIPGKPKNVEGLIFKSQQSGYLVGYLSGLVSKAKHYTTVSTVGGQDIPSVTAYIAGFQAGARAADPKIKLLNAFSNNFADQAPCETLADNQIAQGSKIVFQVAGGCGLGALQAAKQHGVYGIGVDADQGYLGSYILTSALKRVNNAVFQATQDLLHGKFTGGGNLVYDVNNNGTGYGRLNAVAKPYAKQLQKLLAEIKAGKINVPTTMLVK
ncbi:MAG: BMP family ABC transporter substrate-binding protein [Actinomycetota bacterium]|nr:BMP family ABC transporter substrate-binding protein [Actinomycetota bacterium]